MLERVIIAGGGTGGHLFPGVAVVEELRRREPEIEALFVGTARGIETRVLPPLGEQLSCIEVAPLKGRKPRELVKNVAGLPKAAAQALSIVRRFRPDLVIGVGGYASGPMVAAAKLCGVKTALLEQNAHVGLTNRWLARWVDRAYLSFEETAGLFPATAVRVVGNPVRRQFVSAARLARMDGAAAEMRARRILVIGGSQGARSLNEIVPRALATPAVREAGLSILHQTGHAMLEQVQALYAQLGLTAEVTPFIADMARAYASSAVVIARAGATSLAEICAIGRPSILIPFPQAADDHQWHNARAIEQRGGAITVRESELTAENLGEIVGPLLRDPARRQGMAEAARQLGRPEAAAAIVDDLYALTGSSSRDGETSGAAGAGDEDADASGDDTEAKAQRVLTSFPPTHAERRARRRPARRSVAWSQSDRYYGTYAAGGVE